MGREGRFWRDYGRAFGGAIIFGLPLLMTMEMWWLGFTMEPLRLALLLVLFVPVLTLLSHFAGFEETFDWDEDLLDAFAAYAVGFVAAAAVLSLFAVLGPGMSAREMVGKISLQAVPASIGAMLARSQLGTQEEPEEERREHAGYWGELFLVAVGALFVGFNVAPTEEMVLIAHKMTQWHALALVLVSLAAMHAFVYSVGFRGGDGASPEDTPLGLFLRMTVVGYAVALLVSVYVLWTFGRTDGLAASELLGAVLVLGFPSAIGAAAARLIL